MKRTGLLPPNNIPFPRMQRYERYLPNAFDESLSILDKVNKVIKFLQEYADVTDMMLEKWNEVYHWVMNEGLDDAIGYRLQEMVEDGTLDRIINEKIFGDLNRKIDDGLENLDKKIDSGLEEMSTELKGGLEGLRSYLNEELKEFGLRLDKEFAMVANVFNPYNANVSVSQSKKRFIDMMNAKARDSQMLNTSFVNPHGLNASGQASTAFDMALMTMQATGYPELVEAMGKRKHTSSIEGPNARKIDIATSVDYSSLNENHIISGAKTGTVRVDGSAVNNLVAFGQPKRTGSFFVGAVMNASPSRYTAMRTLFDVAQSSMQSKFDFKYHTNNLTNGNFDDGFTGWTRNGSPILDKVDYLMFPNAVNVGSYGTSAYLSRRINLTRGNVYYVSAYVKCTRHEAGYIGLQVSGLNPTQNARLARTTRGWSKVSLRFVAETTSATINVGGMENANLDGLVGAVNIINLTTAYGAGSEPSKEYMDSEQWRNISGGSNGAGVAMEVSPNANGYDLETLEVLFNKNGGRKYPPASLTKVMTAMLLLDHEKDLSRKVRIIESDITAGSGSRFYDGDILTLQDCLYHLMLESSNTIATALSRLIGKKVIILEQTGVTTA